MMPSQRNPVAILRRLDEAAVPTAIILDGSLMTTKSSVFAEFSAAFSFPAYFGKNWDAFEECIGDYAAERPGTVIPFTITRAGRLLADAPDDDFAIFIRILDEAGRAERTSFTVTLNDDNSSLVCSEDRLRRNQLSFVASSSSP